MRRLAALGLMALAFASLRSADPPAVAKPPLSEPRQRLNAGNYAEARKGYEALLQDATHGPAATIGLAQSWLRVGDSEKALAALNDGLKQFPDHADLLAARGDLHYDCGRWPEAVADASAAAKKNEGHFLARWIKARILRDSGKLDDAETEMRWFVRAYTAASNADKDITDPDTLLIIGQAGAEHARWHNLTKQFSFILNDVYGDTLKYEPDCWMAEYLIGSMLLEKHNRPDANAAFDKALTINPSAAEAYVGKGLVALAKFELREAEEFAEAALARNKNHPAALRLKADIHLMSGELHEAAKALKAALAVNGKDEVAAGKLAAVLTIQKKPDDVATLVKAVEQYDAKPAVFYQEMGEYLETRQVYAAAEECYAKAAALRPKMSAPTTSLGMLYLRMGREAEGRKLLDAAYAADKFNIRVANMRKVMEHLDRYESIKTPHYEVKFDGTKDRLLAEFVAEYLEEVHADLKKQCKHEPAGVIPLQIFSRHEMFSGRTTGLPDLHTIGACTGRVVTMASPTAQGVKRPFNWGRVIRHELVHVFNLDQTQYKCPHWLTEGLAVRNEQMKHPHAWTQALREAFENNTLFNLDDIVLGFVKPKSQSRWMLAYCQSHLYVDYVINRYGEEVLPKLLKAYGEGLETDAAIRTATGIEKDVFEAGYKVHLEEVLAPYRKWDRLNDPTAGLTLEAIEEGLKEDPNNVDLKARLAEQHLKRNKPAEARKLADDVLSKEKGHAVATVVRARLLQQSGDDDGAAETLEAAVKANPKDARLLLALGRVHVEAKNYEKAAATLEKGRVAAPLDGDWLEQLARLYTATKQNDKLIAVLEEIVAHDPDELDARLKLARLLLDTGDAKKAVAVARQAIQIEVTNPEVQKLYLECLTKTGGDVEKYAKRFR